MKCTDVQRILLESDAVPEGVKEHLQACPDCGRFLEDLSVLRKHVGSLAPPVLPDALDRRTRTACHESVAAQPSLPAGIPLTMRIIFALVILGTAVWIGLHMPSMQSGAEMTLNNVRVLFLILQNGVTLIFSPLLIRWIAGRKSTIVNL